MWLRNDRPRSTGDRARFRALPYGREMRSAIDVGCGRRISRSLVAHSACEQALTRLRQCSRGPESAATSTFFKGPLTRGGGGAVVGAFDSPAAGSLKLRGVTGLFPKYSRCYIRTGDLAVHYYF